MFNAFLPFAAASPMPDQGDLLSPTLPPAPCTSPPATGLRTDSDLPTSSNEKQKSKLIFWRQGRSSARKAVQRATKIVKIERDLFYLCAEQTEISLSQAAAALTSISSSGSGLDCRGRRQQQSLLLSWTDNNNNTKQRHKISAYFNPLSLSIQTYLFH